MTVKETPKNIAILGSTGSIGENSLDVIRQHSEYFKALYLTANSNIEKLAAQVKEFKPKGVVITNPEAHKVFLQRSSGQCQVLFGLEGISEIVNDVSVDLVLNGLVGGVGLLPTYYAISAGKNVALANKETLVMAGKLIMEQAKTQNIRILPIDSEHSAIWQCLMGEDTNDIKKIVLTGSGGPFREWTQDKLQKATVKQALKHPNWQMGAKITIDSATLMNKGLEVIEAYWLYGVELNQLQVVIHPQSIIHSMVEFCDGSIKAQLGIPDMRIPIQYALTYPQRLPLEVQSISFENLKELTFESPDLNRFPCLEIAYEVLKTGGTAPAVMNAANDTAVNRFLKEEIKFVDIPKIIEKTLKSHNTEVEYSLDYILELEKWAKEFANKIK